MRVSLERRDQLPDGFFAFLRGVGMRLAIKLLTKVEQEVHSLWVR